MTRHQLCRFSGGARCPVPGVVWCGGGVCARVRIIRALNMPMLACACRSRRGIQVRWPVKIVLDLHSTHHRHTCGTCAVGRCAIPSSNTDMRAKAKHIALENKRMMGLMNTFLQEHFPIPDAGGMTTSAGTGTPWDLPCTRPARPMRRLPARGQSTWT